MIYRAVYKQGEPLTSPSGEPTRGTYYFCRMLFSLAEELQPTYMVIAMDPPRSKTFRREIFPAYKRNRGDNDDYPEEVAVQVTRIGQILEALGLSIIKVEGFEADDVIASLVDVCANSEVECVVCSRDKDLHQLVSEYCTLYDPQSREWVTRKEVTKRWGVEPHQVVEVQTLMGDTTDNVPGVWDIGEARAKKLIAKYGTVSELMNNLADLTPAMCRNLQAADLELCRRLVALRRDVPLEISAAELEFDGFDMAGARPLFRKLGFGTWT